MRTFLATIYTFLLLLPVSADEGMWTLFDLPAPVAEHMRGYGYRLSPAGTDSVASAVVSFGGYCTAALASPQGLLLTNHHCGFEAVRRLSTPACDLLTDGFAATTRSDELPCDGLFIAFTRGQRDVTAELDSLGLHTLSAFAQAELIDSLASALTLTEQQSDSTVYVDIDAYYEGNRYIATTYQRYDDVRLVAVVPKSLGKYGGETDNWMWPRQTCDVAVFRVYADTLGRPAPYSPDNRPLATRHYLTCDTTGYAPGDFTMTIGYPGSTRRYLSSYGVEEQRTCINEPMQQVRGVKQAVMRRHMDRSTAVRLKYDSRYSQSANYWKNAIGMNRCLDSLDIIGQKRDYEALMVSTGAWADASRTRLAELYAARAEAMRAQTLFTESFTIRSGTCLATRATQYYNGMVVHRAKHRPRQYVAFPNDSADWDRDTDIDIMAALIDNYRQQCAGGAGFCPHAGGVGFCPHAGDVAFQPRAQVAEDMSCANGARGQKPTCPACGQKPTPPACGQKPTPPATSPAFLPDFYTTIDRDFGGDSRRYVEHLWQQSVLLQFGAHIPARTNRRLRRDPGIAFSLDLASTQADLSLVLDSLHDAIAERERLLTEAKLRMEQDLPHYSDANLTMRLSYGTVAPYPDSGYQTTASTLMAKAYKQQNDQTAKRPNTDYALDSLSLAAVRQAPAALPLCFLTNNDITGGNSGSPVINATGHLLGLAFDGTWQGMAADIQYEHETARCIAVDIRYILYMLRHRLQAGAIADELTH